MMISECHVLREVAELDLGEDEELVSVEATRYVASESVTCNTFVEYDIRFADLLQRIANVLVNTSSLQTLSDTHNFADLSTTL